VGKLLEDKHEIKVEWLMTCPKRVGEAFRRRNTFWTILLTLRSKTFPPLPYSLIFSPFLLLICCPQLSPVFFISIKTHLRLPFLLQTKRSREMMRQRRETEAQRERFTVEKSH